MENSTAHVLLVEDDRDLRESIVAYLRLSGFKVSAASNGLEFYRVLDREKIDVAVIDIGLPDQSGLVLAGYLRNNTGIGVIILTARDGEDDLVAGFEAGADLYFTKPVSSRVLVTAITGLAGRRQSRRVEPGKPTEHWSLDCHNWQLSNPRGEKAVLTDLELKLVLALAAGPDQRCDRTMLERHLYPNISLHYSSRALDASVRRLRKKIAPLGNPLKTVHGSGYCFSEPLHIINKLKE